MKSVLKAIVFKTTLLGETRTFYENVIGIKIEESSVTHFVIYTKGIRILFVDSDKEAETELYISKKSDGILNVQKDPNNIHIITCYPAAQNKTSVPDV